MVRVFNYILFNFRNDKKPAYLVLSFPIRVVLLPCITIKDLWFGDVKQYKVYEVFFEAFPQFLFQLYIICDFGFYPQTHQGHVWSNTLKVLSLLTSYTSLTFGITKYVVYREDNFATKDWRMMVKCYFYTFFDLHFRLGFYLLNCTLMKLRYLVVYAVQSTICLITCLLIKKDYKDVLSFFYIFSVNILPQCVIDKKMKVMMTLKFIYNLIDAILICYYATLLYSFDTDPELFDKVNLLNLSLDRITSSSIKILDRSYGVCHLYENTTQTEEEVMMSITEIPTVITKTDILSIQIPIIAILLLLSSLEIMFFVRCRNTWESFMYDSEGKIDLQVKIF